MSRAEYLSQVAAAPERAAVPARRRPARLRLAAVALGAGVAVALAGCGAGQVSQTAQEESVINGANAGVGDIAIRDAQLAPPDNAGFYYAYGSDAPLILTIVNTGSQDDKLVSVSSSLAKSVKVSGDTAIAGSSAVRSVHLDTDGDTRVPQAPSALPTAPPGPRTSKQGSGEINIVLSGLTVDKLRPGKEVPVTFTFAKAGKVTVNLPVATFAGEAHKAATKSPSVSG